ncbi:MAG TPA: class I SAM-dependent methyltransferase [Puia sp.]|nr:class I SAM-dependent methyltransferase [Puia sp.]
MNPLIAEILDSNLVRDADGNTIPLHSSVHKAEVEFISTIIKDHRLSKAVEVGCAMGISSLAIADAIGGVATASHFIIDPFQKSQWKNIGVTNLQRAGFRNFNLIEDYSEFALPAMVKEGIKVNFGFIDGWHTFDHTLIDFFYMNRMLEPGGVIVIDDVQMPAVNKAIRYIYNYPCYEFAGQVANTEITSKRKVFDTAAKVFAGLKYITGQRVAAELYNPKLLRSDKLLHLNSSMIAFKKISADERDWNWYANF